MTSCCLPADVRSEMGSVFKSTVTHCWVALFSAGARPSLSHPLTVYLCMVSQQILEQPACGGRNGRCSIGFPCRQTNATGRCVSVIFLLAPTGSSSTFTPHLPFVPASLILLCRYTFPACLPPSLLEASTPQLLLLSTDVFKEFLLS